MNSIRIAGRSVGQGHPAYIVAEMSANHLGDFRRAEAIVRVAKTAGADAVKLQTYTPDTMTLDSDKPWFRIEGTLWHGRRLHELYAEAQTPWEWHAPLRQLARDLGLDLFSTPFDADAVAFLLKLDVPVLKIASFECVDIPLVRRAAQTGKPMILSTGMASLAEIKEAVGAVREAGGTELALLKCVSAYPAPAAEMNLRTIPDLASTFGTPVGLSDHTLGIAVAVAAVTLGASIVEKHLTLSRADGGPDSAFSLEPEEFRQMVEAIRTAEASLGEVSYRSSEAEEKSRAFRRSLFVVETVRAGALFNEKNVRSIRPADGLHPRHLTDILGRRARIDIERGTPLSWNLVEGGEAGES
ncbi:MAG TPA: pseudaminic acid synthase [Thermoanaerobaculia bacterium]|nr:pseudaminic acid synthase [Thermoanaerobaculia bacterium]